MLIRKSEVRGKCAAPPSKSISHRAVICAALADGRSVIRNCLDSDDLEATIDACRALGARIKRKGVDVVVEGNRPKAPSEPVNCGESGATIRFIAPIAALANGVAVLTSKRGLLRRPMGPIIDALRQLGVECESSNGNPPLKIEGGMLEGGKVEIPGDVSSQFISGLLLALPLAKKDSEIIVTTEIESKDYIAMTLDAMKAFGVRVETSRDMLRFRIPGNQNYFAREFAVEGDWSSAAFMLAAGALAGEITVHGLKHDSLQGDAAIANLLEGMGAKVTRGEDCSSVGRGKPRSIEVDAKDIPDLVPILAVLATQAEGETRITNAGRLRLKESDRLAAIASELRKMGADIEELRDGLAVRGPTKLRGAVIDPHGDHRIAMACSVAALVAEGETTITNPECVAKSYPAFFQDLRELGGDVMTISNSFGKKLVVTLFGESHGRRVGVILEGCPPGIEMKQEEIQREADRRRSVGALTTARREPDVVQIASGINDGRTTGEAIRLEVENRDVDSSAYEKLRDTPKPGHADYTARIKLGGLHDHRGGGQFSGRMTLPLVMAGAIARKLLAREGVEISARLVQVGKARRPENDESDAITREMEEEILKAKECGDSVGGLIECRIAGIRAGMGEPFFDSVESILSHGLFSIPAVKGVEFGSGFRCVGMRGSEHNDEFMLDDGGGVATRTNNAGGILGGISNGMPIILGVAFKPTPSIAKEQRTVDLERMEGTKIKIEGRHDPCVAVRAVPVVEAVAALCIADLILQGEH